MVWEKLVSEGHVEEVLTGKALPEDCVYQARLFHHLWRDGHRNGGGRVAGSTLEPMEADQIQEDVASRLNDYEDERSEAYSAYLAKAAAGNRRVQSYRERHLGRGLLTQEKAKARMNRSRRSNDSLRKLCRSLSGRYPWTEDEAMRFVLTGKVPDVPSLYARIRLSGSEDNLFSYGTVTLRVEPWVSAESVERFYREMQSQMLGRKPRKLERRNVALFRFVVERCEAVEWGREEFRDENGYLVRDESGDPVIDWGLRKGRQMLGKPPWRELLTMWNERYPEGHEWHYKEVWNFQRDFGRAASAIPFPITSKTYDALSSDGQETKGSTI
jgi:hypothetical protein